MKIDSIIVIGAALGTALGILASSANAQEVKNVSSATFKQSRVLVPENGKTIETTNDVALPGEILVKTNGVFAVKKGKERQLREGQTISDGLLTSQDGSVMPVVDHLVLKGGKVQLVKDGEATPLGAEFVLPDAARVSPDGSIKARDGRLRRMLDGQIIKLDGVAIPATDTVSLQQGKVVLFKDGGRVELRRGQVMAMSDGSRVNGDGFLVRADGTRVALREGEIVKLPGVLPSKR